MKTLLAIALLLWMLLTIALAATRQPGRAFSHVLIDPRFAPGAIYKDTQRCYGSGSGPNASCNVSQWRGEGVKIVVDSSDRVIWSSVFLGPRKIPLADFVSALGYPDRITRGRYVSSLEWEKIEVVTYACCQPNDSAAYVVLR